MSTPPTSPRAESGRSPSFTGPYTASGRSALVGPPPWHYAGWLINVAFTCDASRGAQLLPAAQGRILGHGCVHFADWQATSDGSELLDPVYAQYRETIITVMIERPDGQRANYCPFIYVDQDIALLRGLFQGWPKKMGTTWLTRSLPIEHRAAATLRAGARLGASLAVKERRLLDATLELLGTSEQLLGFLAAPTLGTVGWPDLTDPDRPSALRYVWPVIVNRVESGWHAARATLRLHDHPVEELSLLGDLQATRASVGWMGLTVQGARAA